MASSSSGVRSWRALFLTLRDETLASPPPQSLLSLLRRLLLSHPSDALVAAASHLPPHEVTCDVVLLAELGFGVSQCPDSADVLLHICHLIHDISHKVFLDVKSSSWNTMLTFIEKVLEHLLNRDSNMHSCQERTAPMAEALEILRLISKTCGRSISLLERLKWVSFLLSIVSSFNAELTNLYQSDGNRGAFCDNGSKNITASLWSMQTIVLSLVYDALIGIGSSFPENLWESVIEVLMKISDFLSLRKLLIENNVMSSKSCLTATKSGLKQKSVGSHNVKLELGGTIKNSAGAYVPPHLRKKVVLPTNSLDTQGSSDSEPSNYGFVSSDSDHSDTDGSRFGDRYRSSKVRLATILCIQDICRSDPKSLASLWTLLLPENDALQQKSYQATLVSCIIFDPVVKIRIESASTIAMMLEGHSLTLSQVAEYKELSRCGSFTTLSTSLGQKLMQLHTGLLYLLQHETHNGLLASLFKVVLLLISATPYTRMPGELLPTLIASLHTKIVEIFAKDENSSLLVSALACLGAALSRSSPSVHILKMLEEGVDKGATQDKGDQSILNLLFHLSEKRRHPAILSEALQTLRTVVHNYPSLINKNWEQISATVTEIIQIGSADATSQVFASIGNHEFAKAIGAAKEKCIMSAIKVLDEGLRAASGFKGADDLLEGRFNDIQYISDRNRDKKVSSAPLYELDILDIANDCSLSCSSGIEQWSEVVMKHLPIAVSHASSLVRAAAITCFAGMTSGVFSSLSENGQEFIISSIVNAALSDTVPAVRSSACRAIGVISCFPQLISLSGALNEFIQAVDSNTRDHHSSVRVTASWALANICDCFRYKAIDFTLDESDGKITDSNSVRLLAETALRLTKDGDKIKSNAVRALGNISRFIKLTPHSISEDGPSVSNSVHGDAHWLERMVQALVSCVTTGNVKVQWNVCHALSNLFMNDSIKLHDKSWAPTVYSVLLLLLRGSTNYKIRIHAAIALAVPTTRLDYGSAYCDVVQSLENIRESLVSENAASPSSFRYKEQLEKQINVTTLHVLGFVSPNEEQSLNDFLIKKASFLEEWFKKLSCTIVEAKDQPPLIEESSSSGNMPAGLTSHALTKAMISKAFNSVLHVYKRSNNPTIVKRFKNLAEILL